MARRIIREGKLQSQSNAGGITRITVGGFKSIYPEQRIEIKPLTMQVLLVVGTQWSRIREGAVTWIP